MSTTISAAIVSILATVLPLLGVEIGTEALTTTLQTIVLLVSSLWVWKERVKRGDVTKLGKRK